MVFVSFVLLIVSPCVFKTTSCSASCFTRSISSVKTYCLTLSSRNLKNIIFFFVICRRIHYTYTFQLFFTHFFEHPSFNFDKLDSNVLMSFRNFSNPKINFLSDCHVMLFSERKMCVIILLLFVGN